VDENRVERKYAGFLPLVAIFGGAAAGAAVADAIGWPTVSLAAPGFVGGYFVSRHLINKWFAADR
jgi:hypothetical protein